MSTTVQSPTLGPPIKVISPSPPAAPQFTRPAIPWLKILSLLPIIALAVWPLNAELSYAARTTLVVFAAAVWAWVLTDVNDTLIALTAASALVLVGILDVDKLFAPLGEHTTWLLIGAFIVSSAIAASGLAQRTAVYLVAGVRSPRLVVHLLVLASVCTAFLVPATSGRAALILPIFESISPHTPAWLRKVLAIILPSAVLFSAIASLIGAGAHLISNQILNGAGLEEFSFSRWLMLGLPCALLTSHLAAEAVFLSMSNRRERRAELDITLPALSGPMTRSETRTLSIVSIAVLLWFSEGIHGIPAAMVAVLAALVVTAPHLGSISLNAGVKKVPWSLLLFMTATIALSTALQDSGASTVLGNVIQVGDSPQLYVVVLIVVSSAAHLLIASRSARSAVLIPVVVATAPAAGVDPLAAVFISTAAAGFCHTLPASAKPLAIFQDYYLPRDLLKAALVMAPIHLFTMSVCAFWLWPMLGLPLLN